MTKRLIPFILALVILFSFLLHTFAEESRSAETTYSTSVGDFRIEYTLNEKGEATITNGQSWSGRQMYVPEELDGHRVVAIGDYAFQYYSGSFYKADVEKVYIPASIKYIGANPFRNW